MPQASSDPVDTTHEVVTTSVARKIRPDREQEFIAWTDAGLALARTFPGFLGAGWMKSTSIPDEYYVIYRFIDEENLDNWDRSPLRRHWLERGEGVATQTSTHRLSGIEGWFEPQSTLTNAVRVMNAPPPRWKQAISIWLAFFPLSLAVNYLLLPHLSFIPTHDWGIALRTLLASLISTPLMVFVLMPFITGRLRKWLAG